MRIFRTYRNLSLFLLLCLLVGTVYSALPLRHIDAAQPTEDLRVFVKISGKKNDLGDALRNGGRFGSAVATVGDLDGDGIAELAVGAPDDADVGATAQRGAVWILFLKRNGKVTSKTKLSATTGGLNLETTAFDRLGSALVGIGDLNRDGVNDLAVGVPFAHDGGPGRGAVWLLFLNADGTVKEYKTISDTAGGMERRLRDDDFFGASLATVGDLDGDGVVDLVVGAPGDDDGGEDGSRGALWILNLTTAGTAKSQQKISATAGRFGGQLAEFDQLGLSVTNIGDVNRDGVTDLGAGVMRIESEESSGMGAFWVIFLNRDGTVRAQQELGLLSGTLGPGPSAGARYGSALTGIGDYNGDSVPDLAIGAPDQRDDVNEKQQGGFWVLNLNRDGLVNQATRISAKSGGIKQQLRNGDQFSWSLTNLGDLNNDGVVDLAIGAPGDDDGGPDRGAVWLAMLR